MPLDGPLSHREEILRAIESYERSLVPPPTEFDDLRTNSDWVALMVESLGASLKSNAPPEVFRKNMIVAVSIGIAALETQARKELQRQEENEDGRTN